MRDVKLNRKHLEDLGTSFERAIASSLKYKFTDCIVLHNLSIYSSYLEKETQIDLVVITKHNVYVIEAKNWSGYISGNYNDTNWIGRSRALINMTVFNPINQNMIHIRALRNALRMAGINPPVFRNLVVVPDGTTINSKCSEVVNETTLILKINEFEKQSSLELDRVKIAQHIKEVCK